MEKEYFFVLKLKNGATITVWDFIPQTLAERMCKKLQEHFGAVMSSYRSPSDFKCFMAFLNLMKQDGFNGSVQLSPI